MALGLAETADLAARLTLKDDFSRQIGRAKGALNSFDKATSNTQRSLAKFGSNLGKIATAGVVGLASAAVVSAKFAGDFEAQLNTINTIARTRPEGLKKIGDSIRQIARDTGTPLEELTQGYYDLLSAGVKVGDAQKVLEASNRLAIGGLATTAETVDLLTTALNTYGLAASDAGHVADVFAKTVERGKVTAAELAESFAQVGPIAAASGVSIEELGAAYAQLTASGVPAAEAATEVRSAIVALTKTTPALDKLQKATGKNYLTIAGRQGLVVALQQMRKDADKAGIPLIDLLGRVEGLNFTLATTGPNFQSYNDNLAAMKDSAGTAAEQMSERQKGLNFQLSRLKALARDAGITVGSALLPKLTPLVEKLNTLISSHQGDIEKFGTQLAGAFERFAAAIEKVDWQPFIDGLKLSGDIAKTAFDVFNALPDDFKKLILVGAGINKVTGGLVTSIGKDLFGAIGSNFFARGSSPANPLFVAVTGGLPGGAGGPGGVAGGGGKGALGKGVELLAKVALIGVVAEVAKDIHDATAPIGPTLTSNLQWPFGPANTPTILPEIFGDNGLLGGTPGQGKNSGIRPPGGFNEGETAKLVNVSNERLEAIKNATQAQNAKADALNASFSHVTAQDAINAALTRAAIGAAGTSESSAIARAGAAQSAAVAKAGAETRSEEAAVRRAVQAKKLSVTVPITVNTNVSVRETIKQRTTYKKYHQTLS